MARDVLTLIILAMMAIALSLSPARGAEPSPPTITVDAEGKVMAKPDMANLILEVETQATKAEAAGQENARRADGLLKAVKKLLAPEEKVQSLGYRLTPLRSREKSRPREITGYQAIHRFQVQVRDLAKLGPFIDNFLKNGASRVQGPYFVHSRQEELQRQAAVDALGKARRLAEALAQAAGVKIKGLKSISTAIRPIVPRAAPEGVMAAARAEVPTPIEVGEEEIRANIQAVFKLTP
jgi:uncharacterized protein YggE